MGLIERQCQALCILIDHLNSTLIKYNSTQEIILHVMIFVISDTLHYLTTLIWTRTGLRTCAPRIEDLH